MAESLCQLGEVSRQITDDAKTAAGFAVCQLCERMGFMLVSVDQPEGQRPLIRSELVESCDAGEMPLYPEIQYQGSD